MPKNEVKSESPLQIAGQDGDEFKKEVINFVNDGQEALKEKDVENSASRIRNLYQRSKELITEHDRLLTAAEALDKENEPSKVMRFDSKKKDEIKRLTKLKEKLDECIKKLALDDVEEDYLKKAATGEVKAEESEEGEESEEVEEEEGEEEEEEGEDEEWEEGEEEEEMEEESGEEEEVEEEEGEEEESGEEEERDTDMQTTGTMRQYQALETFNAQQDGDLGFKKGDILTILFAREDGWLEAKDSGGKTGLVPSTFLKVYSSYKDVKESDGEEGEEDDEETDPKTPRSGRLLWKNIKKAVNETSVTDVLHAMGAVPAGFRDSTLGKLAAQDYCRTKSYLAPKLSPSSVAYRDLFYDNNKIRAMNARIQRIVAIVSCRQIPLPGSVKPEGRIEVTSRHIRVCLHDGKNVLSNVHTLRIQSMDKDQRTWNFNSKATEAMKSLEFSEFFVRSNSTEGNIGILIELGMSYIRETTQQEGEFSCGWVHLPLFDDNGAPAPNKTYDLFVNGGSPYEKGVDVDPTVGRRASTNPFRSLMSGNRQPRLTVRIQVPTKDQKDFLDTLPHVLVSSTAYIQYLSFYRQILADTLIGDCIEPESTDLINHPLLALFPAIADQSDLMDVLRSAWADKLKTAKRSEKRDQEAIKRLFEGVFMDNVYPLYHSASLPAIKFGSQLNEQERYTEIQRLLTISRNKKAAVAMLLSPEAAFTPFNISEISFGVIGSHCKAH